jgi:predicted phosphodiesterase
VRLIVHKDTIGASQSGERVLYHITDTHLGAVDTDEDTLRALVKQIDKDPLARWTFGGDLGDLIGPHDRRWHPHQLPERYRDAMFEPGGLVEETIQHGLEIFDPIRDKMLGWIGGNHERSARKYMGDREIGLEVCRELGFPSRYLGYGGFIRWEWGFDGSKSSVVIDMHHGWQGGRKSGAKINQAELDFSMSNADIVLRGHSHDRQAHVFESVRVYNKSLIPWPRVYVNGGTFKTGNINSTGKASDRGVDDTWEETRGFRRKWGTLIGPPPIVIKAKRRSHKGDEHPPFTYEVRI